MDASKLNIMLNIQALAIFVLAVVLVSLGEMAILPVECMGPDYWTEYGMYLGMLIAVPLALKLLYFNIVKEQVKGKLQKYMWYAELRLFLLTVPIILGLLYYYLMNEVSMLYCALIAAMAFLYIWPSKSRMEREMQVGENEE